MPLLQVLYDTYKCITSSYSELPQSMKKYYMSAKIAFSITIDRHGNFIKVEQNDKKSIYMPCTEKSAGRTSGICANPLFDKICYLIDNISLMNFVDKFYFQCKNHFPELSSNFSAFSKIKEKFDCTKNLNSYLEQMNSWIEYENNFTVKEFLLAIVTYINKGSILDNITYLLVNSFMEKYKKQLPSISETKFSSFMEGFFKNITDSFVEFSVSGLDISVDSNELYNAWVDYYEHTISSSGNKVLSALSGKLVVPATGYPKKIRHDGDQTKLISSNDKYLSYLGRFTSETDTSQIGLAENQEIHLMMSWLMRNAYVHIANQYTAIWAKSNNTVETTVPNILNDRMFQLLSSLNQDNSEVVTEFSVSIWKAIAGKFRDLKNAYRKSNTTIYILTVDNATSGRLSVTRFLEKNGYDYLEHIENWVDDTKVQSVKKVDMYYSPNLYNIGHILYGKKEDDISKKFFDQIFDCAINGKNIPLQYIKAFVNKVRYSSHEEKIYLLICKACSFIRCFYKRNQGGDLLMLDKKCSNRSYLFGRLLALADNIESFVNQKTGTKRSTIAMRLLSIFADRPSTTWLNIVKSLSPYIQRLESLESDIGFISSRKKIIDEVMSMMTTDEFSSNEKLESIFLLGFHHQRASLYGADNSQDNSDDTI